MVESIMYFGAGFLVAGVLALVLISFVHHRAVRLTLRRLEDAIPVSLAEIQADKDKLRAEFAMSARRREMTVEQLKSKATTQLGELARKSEAIARLKAELAEKTTVADELDAKSRNLSVRVHETEQEHAVQFASAETAQRALAAREAELAGATVDINELTLASETQKVEIALLKTQIEQYKSRISEMELEADDAARRLFDERVAVSTVNKALEERREAEETWRAERAENDLLRERIADIAAQVAHMSMDRADSTIAEILKEAASIRQAGSERIVNGSDGRPAGSLTDRIRNLRKAASGISAT